MFSILPSCYSQSSFLSTLSRPWARCPAPQAPVLRSKTRCWFARSPRLTTAWTGLQPFHTNTLALGHWWRDYKSSPILPSSFRTPLQSLPKLCLLFGLLCFWSRLILRRANIAYIFSLVLLVFSSYPKLARSPTPSPRFKGSAAAHRSSTNLSLATFDTLILLRAGGDGISLLLLLMSNLTNIVNNIG